MKTFKIEKREIEEEVVDKCSCDNCKKEIEHEGACGMGVKYHLSDAWCTQCGGKSWDFCCLECLREFIKKEEKEWYAK